MRGGAGAAYGAAEKAVQEKSRGVCRSDIYVRPTHPSANRNPAAVIPAHAGIHLRVRVNTRRLFIPRRSAGTPTKDERRKMDSGFRRNDGEHFPFRDFFNTPEEGKFDRGGVVEKPCFASGGMQVHVAWAGAMVLQPDNPGEGLSGPPWPSLVRTGAEACPYGRPTRGRVGAAYMRPAL